jgi:hypothetical protein
MVKDQLETELDMLMARAGVAIPADRRERLLASFADLREQVGLVHAPREATAEPSNIFRAMPVARAAR